MLLCYTIKIFKFKGCVGGGSRSSKCLLVSLNWKYASCFIITWTSHIGVSILHLYVRKCRYHHVSLVPSPYFSNVEALELRTLQYIMELVFHNSFQEYPPVYRESDSGPAVDSGCNGDSDCCAVCLEGQVLKE